MRSLHCTGYEPIAGMSRRDFLNNLGLGLGGIAVSELLRADAVQAGGSLDRLHFAPKAKRVIYLFQSGAPSQIDLFDYKPLLNKKYGAELPDEIRRGQRLTTMSGSQSSFPLVGSPFKFQQYGQSGAWLSELLPHTATVVDELCFVNSRRTDSWFVMHSASKHSVGPPGLARSTQR